MFCFCVFLAQLFNLLKSYVSPTTTNTYVEEMPLESIDFPLEIILCVKPGLNATALRSLGYHDAFAYILGYSRYNSSLVGWVGDFTIGGAL